MREVVDLCVSSDDEAAGADSPPSQRPADVLVIDDDVWPLCLPHERLPHNVVPHDREKTNATTSGQVVNMAERRGGGARAAPAIDAHAASKLRFCPTPACPQVPSDLLPSIWLLPGRTYLAGREPSEGCELVCLQSSAQPQMVSRAHAKISCTAGGEWRVVDLGSTNGVLLNGRRVAEAMLAEGVYAACVLVCVRACIRACVWALACRDVHAVSEGPGAG